MRIFEFYANMCRQIAYFKLPVFVISAQLAAGKLRRVNLRRLRGLSSGQFFVDVFSVADAEDKDSDFLPAYRINYSVIAAADTVKTGVQKFFAA
jgi:hypothetical protein